MTERDLGSRFASADESAGLLLWRVTNRWQAAIRAALKPHGLTHVQYVLLASLTWNGGEGDAVTQAELAASADTDPMMTSQVLRALEARGLVGRAEHPTDRRARLVAVTPQGAEAARRATADVEATDARFFGVLGARAERLPPLLRALLEER